jgi:hypothetical protein
MISALSQVIQIKGSNIQDLKKKKKWIPGSYYR